MKKTALIVMTIVLTVFFITFSGCVETDENTLKENITHEDNKTSPDNFTIKNETTEIYRSADDRNSSTETGTNTIVYSTGYSGGHSSGSAKSSSKTPVTSSDSDAINAAPVATIISITPNPATEGSSVEFKGNGTDEDGTIEAYLWTIDGEELSKEANFTTADIAIGTHNITFSVQDDDEEWSEAVNATLNVTEIPNVAPVATSSINPNPATEGSSVEFKGKGADEDGTIEAYLWTIDGEELSTEANFTAADIAIGTHIITFSAQDNDGEWSEEANTFLTITEVPNVAPTATISSITPNPATEGSSVEFKGNGTDEDGTIEAYLWTIDGEELSTEANFNTADIAIGTHNVTFSVQDDDEEWSEAVNVTLNITEIPNVAPTATSSINPNPATEGSSVKFEGNGTDEDGTIEAYLWTIDGEELSTEANFNTADIAIGTHIITFTVQDDDNEWSDAVSSTLTINENTTEVPEENSITVILTFDDGRSTDYDTVYPMLKSRDIRSTHYIIPSMINDSIRMTWDEVEEMYNDGFDIEGHTYTHEDLTTMSSAEVIQEILEVNQAFAAHNMSEPRHIAYPYGEYNDEVISCISPYRDTGRVVTWQTNYSDSLDSLQSPYELPCYPTELGDTIAEIDKAMAGNYTLILGFHEVCEEPGPYGVTISEFTSILDYIEANNIRTQTIAEYYDENFANA